MKCLVFGSMNIDKTYYLDHLVLPGETISAAKLKSSSGGKGFNQAIALRRAGRQVWMAGAVGTNGVGLIAELEENDVKCEYVQSLDTDTGHAIIQVDEKGQNAIIVYSGANGLITKERIKEVLSHFEPGDLLVAQNEISETPFLLHEAHIRGIRVAFNPSPCDAHISECSFGDVDLLLINETEGLYLTAEKIPSAILDKLRKDWPDMSVVLTLGGDGSVYMDKTGRRMRCGIYRVKPVDATAAGDTFTGYFIDGWLAGGKPESILRKAAVASGIAVSRAGAGVSVPGCEEVDIVDMSAIPVFSE